MELKVANKTKSSAVAGAIAQSIKETNQAVVQAVGPIAVNQAVKGIAIARGYVAPLGKDLKCIPAFFDVVINGEKQTGIRFIIKGDSKNEN